MRKAHSPYSECTGAIVFRMINKLLENPPPFGAVGNIKT